MFCPLPELRIMTTSILTCILLLAHWLWHLYPFLVQVMIEAYYTSWRKLEVTEVYEQLP